MTALIQKIESLPSDFDQNKIDLIKNTVCRGATNDDLQIFLLVCQRTGLDPFMKQIYSIPRGGQRTIQTSIDGLRLIAERTGKYSPGKESIYTYDDKKNLVSSTSYVKKMTKDGTWHDISATAIYSEYNPGGKNTFWSKMPHIMLAKCAEALALRKAFPAEMSGIYTKEEMDQAEPITIEKEVIEKKEPENFHEIADKFFWQFPAEEHNNIQIYLEKYCGHYKKEMWEALEVYNDKEDFLKAYNSWKTKHGITA